MRTCRDRMIVAARVFSALCPLAMMAPGAGAQVRDQKSDKPHPAAVPITSNLKMVAAATPVPAAASKSESRESMIALAQLDPHAVTRKAIERYQREIRDYRCVFTKQERIGGKLRPAEEIEVLFRARPQSVFMKWIRNADGARRALFVDDPSYVDSRGQKVAKVEPNGAIARLLVSEVSIPIHGKEAREASRRSMDEFGFGATLNLLDRLNRIGVANGDIEYVFEGEDRIDGRATLRFARYLPGDKRPDVYPDSKLVIHLDQEWLVPTAVYSYADRAGTHLLGSYVFSQVRLNSGLSERDFQF